MEGGGRREGRGARESNENGERNCVILGELESERDSL